MTQKKRIDTSAGRDALGDSPFAGLGGGLSPTLADMLAAAPARAEVAQLPYKVARTKAGGWPVRMEKRPGNKVATIIDRIEGDAGALASALKKQLATGGHGKDGVVELQGDHRDAVNAFLSERCSDK